MAIPCSVSYHPLHEEPFPNIPIRSQFDAMAGDCSKALLLRGALGAAPSFPRAGRTLAGSPCVLAGDTSPELTPQPLCLCPQLVEDGGASLGCLNARLLRLPAVPQRPLGHRHWVLINCVPNQKKRKGNKPATSPAALPSGGAGLGGARQGDCQEQGSSGIYEQSAPVSLSPPLSREPGVATAAAAGVKSWLEAGKSGRIRLVDPGNMMGCQSCSSLICLVTMSGGPALPAWKSLVLFAHLAHEKCSRPSPCTWNWF